MSRAAGGDSPGASPLPGLAFDRMLGRLARWLRPVGVDVLCRPELELRALAGFAERDGRLLVTRRSRLGHVRPRVPVVVLRSARVNDQLRELAAALPALCAENLTAEPRCSGCNAPLESCPAAEVSARVPARVAGASAPVWRCPRCRQLTWGTAHRDRVLALLVGETLGEVRDPPSDGAVR